MERAAGFYPDGCGFESYRRRRDPQTSAKTLNVGVEPADDLCMGSRPRGADQRFDLASGSWPAVVVDVVLVVLLACIAKAVSDLAPSALVGWLVFVGVLALLVFLLVAIPLRTLLVHQRKGMLAVTESARRQATTDALTGLPNRRSTDELVRRLLRERIPFAVAICDLDWFKTLNDTFGHDAGDDALRLFGNTLRAAVRSDDLVARHSGEEFVVVMPRATKHHGSDALDRARLELAIALTGSTSPPFTFSAGVADTSEAREWRTLLGAKRAGRNRVLDVSL